MADVASPRLFISYSWSSDDHQKWVIDLATALREAGVDVVLDKWDLREGHDAHHFMEKMVSDVEIKKVVMVCDRAYAAKANDRSGGVGTETQIISAELYSKQEQDKFVAVLSEKDEKGNAYLPVYYRSRIYIDLSSADVYARNFEQLLRWAYDKPMYVKPELGKIPAFLSEGADKPTLATTALLQRALDAIRNNRVHRAGALAEYLERFAAGMNAFELSAESVEHDEKVLSSIEAFLPYRNELIEVFSALASYGISEDEERAVQSFLEQLYPLMYSPKLGFSYSEWDWDGFRFIVHEIILYLVTVFLRYERFAFVGQILRHPYYVANSLSGGGETVGITDFYKDMKSLERRNYRLNLRRVSVRADVLFERSKSSGLSFEQLMQAEFILFMRDCVDVLRDKGYQSWWPVSLVYRQTHSSFEVFARSLSSQYFAKVRQMFDIEGVKDLEPVFAGFSSGKLRAPSWGYGGINPLALMNSDKLSTKP